MRPSASRGVRYFLRGLDLLQHPRLRPFVIIPLTVNVVIFAVMIYYSIDLISSTMAGWMSAIPDWLAWLGWLIWPLLIIALALLSGYLFSALAILIASPFNGLLAEKAEEIVTGEEVAGPESIAAAFMIFPRALSRELVKFAHYLPLLLGVFILSLIPPVSAIAPLLWFLFGAWMMAVQYVDYPMDNHRLGFNEVKQALRANHMTSLGFGGVVALITGIPLINFFVVPAAVCGATMFWCEELRHQSLP